jgi:hypothetical protein
MRPWLLFFVNLFVLVIASMLAVFISTKAQKSISGPVNMLADTMANVSRDRLFREGNKTEQG